MRIAINLAVTWLSWFVLRKPRHCPPGGRDGMPLSSQQRATAQRIEELVQDWFREPASFSDRGRSKLESLLLYATTVSSCSVGASAGPAPRTGAQAFCAARARFLEQDLHFDPVNFMDVFDSVAFVEPRVLARSTPLATTAVEPRCERNPEILKFALSWDRFHKLSLFIVSFKIFRVKI